MDDALKTQTLHYGNSSDPKSLDPNIAEGSNANNIILCLFEGLINYDPKDLHPIPGVAQSWKISDDGLTYTFFLRKNAKWSNGDPVTAHDFVFSWKRILTPKMATSYGYMLFYVRNAKAYSDGKLADFSQVGVKAKHNYTLVVTLENPTPFFINIMQHYVSFPVHKATIEKYGKWDDLANSWTRPGKIVSNGAFTLKSWQMNKKLVVVKNPLYWDAKNVKLSEVHFYPIDNALTETRMFRSGELHKTADLLPSKIPLLKKKYPENIKLDPYLSVYYYDLNVKRPPFDNKLVRKAFAMAVDRESIVQYVTKAGQKPTGSLVPPNTNGYYSPTEIPFDVKKAKELLAQAGYPDGKGFPTVEVMYNTTEGHKVVAEAIQQMWNKYLGVKVTLANQDWKVFIDTRNNHDFTIARDGWIGDYNDPNTFLDMFVTGGPQNHTGFSNVKYDRLIAKAATIQDKEKRNDIFKKAEAILLDEAPIIPMYVYTTKYLLHTDVKDWHANLLNVHPLRHVYLERK